MCPLSFVVILPFVVASGDLRTFINKYEVIHLNLIVVSAFASVILTSGMIWYGSQLLKQLQGASLLIVSSRSQSTLSNGSGSETQKKIAIILRINLVLIGCNFCFCLRIGALIALLVAVAIPFDIHMGVIIWFLFPDWIPILFPVRLFEFLISRFLSQFSLLRAVFFCIS